MTTEATERDLVTEVEELLANATPGPWAAQFCAIEGPITPTGKMSTLAVAVRPTHEKAVNSPTAPNNAKLIAAAPELLRRLVEEVKRRDELIVHMYVHSGYHNNGYMQMTTPQKALYDEIWNRSVKELDDEEQRNA